MVWIAGNKCQVGPGRLVWLAPSLLPIPQRSRRDMVSKREFLLSQIQRPANDFCLWGALHPLEIGVGQWDCGAISQRGTLNLVRSLRNSAGSIRFAHFASLCALK